MINGKKILIIEDDKSISRFLSVALKTHDYDVDLADNGLTGINLFLTNNPDLILLDLGLPDIDGMEVLSQVRENFLIPIIIISARGQEKEKVEALDAGADDYITKPFNIGELLARIRVAFRKTVTNITDKNEVFSFDGLLIDFEKRKVFVDGNETHITPIEFKLLTLLIENKGKVLTHNFIQKKVWGYENDDDYQSLRVFMANIRKKIEKDSLNPRYIITEVGVGYSFADE